MPNATTRWSIILHGGAGTIRAEREAAIRSGCLAALNVGIEILRTDGSAVDAVEQTVRALEDDPTFNAGFGSVLNARGRVQMDAAIMDGARLDIGAVGAIEGVRHPISVARSLLREFPIFLVGDGARGFAQEHGAELCVPETMIAPDHLRAEDAGSDTVGCVALDVHGNIASGLSTGGLRNKLPGRIGDSPLPGCGFYADNAVGGVAFSGVGESIARLTLAARVMRDLEANDPNEAVGRALTLLPRSGGVAGAIAIDVQGRIGWGHSSPSFAIAYASSARPERRVYLQKREELPESGRP